MNQQQYLANLNAIKANIETMILEVDNTKYITNDKACAILGISGATLSRLANKYKLKDPKIKGHSCYIKSEVMKLKSIKEANKIQFKD